VSDVMPMKYLTKDRNSSVWLRLTKYHSFWMVRTEW